MGNALSPSLIVANGVVVRRKRELPAAGTLTVKKGELVNATSEVGFTTLEGDLHILKISEQMSITAEEVIKNLRVKEGQRVEEGELLLEQSGLFGLLKTRFYAPLSGTVEYISRETGHIGLRTEETRVSLNAYISGVVVETEEAKSIEIETTATVVQGVFGVGGEKVGELMLMDCSDDKPLSETDIPASVSGKILVGGTLPSIEFIQRVSSMGAKGLVVASVLGEVLEAYLGYDVGIAITGDEEIPMTIILTEGFGALNLPGRIRAKLKPLQGRMSSINGKTQVRAGAVRPELIIPTEEEVDGSLIDSASLEVGQRVRIIRVPWFGVEGKVIDLPVAPEKLETGAYARVAQVELDSGRLIRVARANLELL